MSSRSRHGLVCALGLGLAGSGLALLPVPAASAAPVSITLVGINDLQGRISSDGGSGSTDAVTYSTIELATTLQGIRDAKGAGNVLFLSAGDNIGASSFVSAHAADQPTIDVLNTLDLAASTIGNHELDRGWPWLRDHVVDGVDGYRTAQFPILGANVYLEGTTTPALPAYVVRQVAGVDVCMIGAVTRETPTLVAPGGISMLDIGDPVAAVNRVAADLAAADTCDVVVASYHEGAGAGTPDGATLQDELDAGGPFADIVEHTSASVDVVLTGHTRREHAWTAPKPGGGTRPIIQTGSYGQQLGQVDLSYDASTDEVSVGHAGLVRVGTVENLADPVVAEVDRTTRAAEADAAVADDVPAGSITSDITTAFTGGTYVDGVYQAPLNSRDDRLSESTLGDLVADALHETRISDIPGLPTPDLGVVNPAGPRNELLHGPNQAGSSSPQDAPGVVTVEEANKVLPFANNISYVTLTGAQLRQVLEQQWQTTADGVTRPSRPYLQLGLSKNVQVVAKPDTSATSPVGGNILGVTIDGRPLVADRDYVVATYTFLARGGDNFRAFKLGTDRDTAKVDRDLWIDGYLGNGVAKSPSFARRQVFATGMPTGAITRGQGVAMMLSKLNLTSLGAPANTALEVQQVLDGTPTQLGSFPVTNGVADVAFTVPDDAYGATVRLVAQPSGTTVSFPQLPKAASTMAASVSTTSPGQTVPVTVTVDSAVPADGTATVALGGAVVGTGAVTDGRGTIAVPRSVLRTGTTRLTVSFTGPQVADASTAVDARVSRAASRSDVVRVHRGAVKAGRTRAVVRVVVSSLGRAATGRVEVRAAGRVLVRTLRSGAVTVTLPCFASRGRKVVTARYLGSASTAPSSDTLVIKVRRR